MPEATAILEFETQHFTVRLDENQLKIDLKGSLKNDIEEALENKPILKETIGGILSMFVPLHIRLTEIESVRVNETGKVKISLPHRRDILIPLELKDAEKLADKLNELIPRAKKKRMGTHHQKAHGQTPRKSQKTRQAHSAKLLRHDALVFPNRTG